MIILDTHVWLWWVNQDTLWRQQQWQHETVHSLAEQARELRRLSQN